MAEKEFRNCFVCGKDNPIGLKLDFYSQDNSAWCLWETHQNFEGYPEIMHGGIIATLLDEVMAKAILSGEQTAVTRELSIKYLKPALLNKTYKVFGQIVRQRKKIIECTAHICDTEDETHLIATACATYWQTDI